MKLMAPSFNEAMISDRRTVANYMTEGSAVAIGTAITTSCSVGTAPPKPIFMRIMAGGVVGAVLGGLLAWLVIWYYRKEVLRG